MPRVLYSIMSNPKNHHYVPKSYQLLFSEKGEKLFFYDKGSEKTIGPAKPRNFCAENYLYSLVGNAADLSDNDTMIESTLLSAIDGAFVAEVRKLLSENPDKTDLSLYNLAKFFGFLTVRQPEKIFEAQKRFDYEIKSFTLNWAKNDQGALAKAKELDLDLDDETLFNSITMSESRNVSLFKMLEQAEDNAEFIYDSMSWKFLYAKDFEFILSDNPFIVIDGDMGIPNLFEGSEDYIFYIPLSKELCVAFSDSKGSIDYAYVKKDVIEKINNLVFDDAIRWLIGSSPEALLSAVEYNKVQQK